MTTKTGEADACRPTWIERVERTVDAVAREHVLEEFRRLVDQFTGPERDIFHALLRGHDLGAIAEKLDLPAPSVEAAYCRLATKSRVITSGELIRIATWSGY